jgi:hypothetical protein
MTNACGPLFAKIREDANGGLRRSGLAIKVASPRLAGLRALLRTSSFDA